MEQRAATKAAQERNKMAKASKGKAGAKALIGKAAKALAKALTGKKGKAVAKAKSGKKDKAGLKDVSGKDEEKDSNDDDPKGRGKKRKAIATDTDVGASKLQGEDASSSDPKKSALAQIKRPAAWHDKKKKDIVRQNSTEELSDEEDMEAGVPDQRIRRSGVAHRLMGASTKYPMRRIRLRTKHVESPMSVSSELAGDTDI
jgi:hypothetical protein